MTIHRREFLARAAASAAAAALLGRRALAQEAKTLELRALGTTGRRLPRLGMGCFPLSTVQPDRAAVPIVERALELGVRYFDTAPSYGSGRSETLLGRALKGAKREELWIATKTLERGADGARRELERSLERLGVDYVDSIQCHEVHDDFESLFKKESVLDALKKAVDEKLVRHVGITCHRHPKYAKAAIERFPFATALVPVNAIDVQHFSFVKELLPFAAEKKVAVIAMKIFAGGKLVAGGALQASECLTFALAQPQVDVAVPGCGSVKEVDEAFAVAAGFVAPSDDILRDIERRAGRHEGTLTEWYKSG